MSGNNIIIDSSKSPASLIFLSKFTKFDIYILHLVRDSRGVAFSWAKKNKIRPEVIAYEAYMPVSSPIKSSLEWIIRNLMVEYSKKFVTKYIFLRYEDFVKSPLQTIKDVFQMIDERSGDEAELNYIDGKTIIFNKVNHSVSGNPARFQDENITIHEDLEWRRKMNPHDRRIVNFLTFILLWKYKYPITDGK